MKKEKEKLFYAGLELFSKEEAELLSKKYDSFDDIIDSIYVKLFEELVDKLHKNAQLIDVINDPYGIYYAQKVKYFSNRLYIFSIRYDLSTVNISGIDQGTDKFADKYIEAWKTNLENEKREALEKNFAIPRGIGMTIYIYRTSSTNQFLQYKPTSYNQDLEVMSEDIVYGSHILINHDESIIKEFEKFLLKKFSNINLSKQASALLYLYNDNNFPVLLMNTIKYKEYLFLLNDLRYRTGAKNIISKKSLTSIEAYYIVNRIKEKEEANLEHVSLKIREAGDLFKDLEDYDIPWNESMYAHSSIKEILKSINSDEEISLPSLLFVIKYINDKDPRRAVLSIKKIIKKLSEIKDDILVIPVIEYLSRLVDYQGYKLKDVTNNYLEYIILLENNKDIIDINDLRTIFPPSLKVASRNLFFRHKFFANNNLNELVESSKVNIIEEFSLGDYRFKLINDVDSYESDFIPLLSYNQYISNRKQTFALYKIEYKDLLLGVFMINGLSNFISLDYDKYISYAVNVPIKYHKDKIKKHIAQTSFNPKDLIQIKSA